MAGWIKLHRKITKWEWYDDGNTFRLFMHLLLMANHQDGSWHGISIKRGQHLTGRKKLAKALKLGERSIRTSLNNLKSTNEVTIQTTNRYSIITVVNYNAYNDKDIDDDQPSDQPAANNRPTTDQQPTTNKNEKNEKNEKEVKAMQDFEEFWKAYPARNGKKVEKASSFVRYKAMPLKDRPAIMTAVKNYTNSEMVKKGIGIKDPKRFLSNWKDWQEGEKGSNGSVIMTAENSEEYDKQLDAVFAKIKEDASGK
jgi:hypothetical protein